MRLAGVLAGVLAVIAIGESCGLKPPGVPHLGVRTGAAPASTPAPIIVALAVPGGQAAAQPDLPAVRLASH
jgi:hypothetical protein